MHRMDLAGYIVIMYSKWEEKQINAQAERHKGIVKRNG